MSGSADWENAKAQYPSTTKLTQKDWVSYFDEHPDVVTQILGDIYVVTKADQSATKKSGRRPKHINGNMDELWGMITPRYSTEPFGYAVKELIGDQSIRSFAPRIPMHYWSLIRLMKGERQIVNPFDIAGSMTTLEMVAKAGKVQPAYFAEYRTLYIFQLLDDVFTSKPNFTIGMVRRLYDIEAKL